MFCNQETEQVTKGPTSKALSLPWTHPTLPSQDDDERIVIKLWHQWKGEKYLIEALDNLKTLLAKKLNKLCGLTKSFQCGLSESWFSRNGSLFDSDSVLVEATQLSNETLNVEVAVKLPAGAKGKIITCARRYLKFCVTSA